MQAALLAKISGLQESSIKLVDKIDVMKENLRCIPKIVEALSKSGAIAAA